MGIICGARKSFIELTLRTRMLPEAFDLQQERCGMRSRAGVSVHLSLVVGKFDNLNDSSIDICRARIGSERHQTAEPYGLRNAPFSACVADLR
jgi:hypothetical protein